MRTIPLSRVPAVAVAAATLLAASGCRADAAPPRAERGDSTPASRAAAAEAQCAVLRKELSLPEGLSESSGLAESRIRPGVYWTHNDSGHDSDLFAVDPDGQLIDQVTVQGATNRDWEDIASGRCPEDSGNCLYIADTGDNAGGGGKHTVRLAVVAEPAAGATTAAAREFSARLPGKRTDIEAMALLPDGRIYLVSKGIDEDIQLFRWPTPLVAGTEATLERVRRLAPKAEELGDRVTGASASPDGRWVAVRTYAALAFYRTADFLGTGGPVSQLDLEPLGESQGEAVSLANDGTVLLTSEGTGRHIPGTIARLRCMLPR
jgi:hypothetical protein